MKNLLLKLFLLAFSGSISTLSAQKMPDEYYFSDDGHILHIGRTNPGEFYDVDSIQEIHINFSQADYLTRLDNNYSSQTNLIANLLINGEALDSAGVRYKGFTSYMFVRGNRKSFNIELDYIRDKQDVDGYNTLNLNNSYGDPSFMREVFYYYNLRRYTPSAKANFVHLYVNGNDYGIYQNVQQYNKDFLEEWFLTNDGSNWRADSPPGTGGGGFGGGGFGGGFGNGTAALNFLGDDTTEYQEYYTLKSSDQPEPWKDLPTVCRILEESPLSSLEQDIAPYLDIDRVLWHLAAEALFADDDSYIYKGGTDYFLYQDAETGRFITYDYDGNSIMAETHVSWSPFYNEDNENFPLMNRLLQVPSLRQRYLAHMRTMIDQAFDESSSSTIIDHFKEIIDPVVEADPTKEVSYQDFNSEVEYLKTFISNRKAYLLQNPEINQAGPAISNLSPSVNGVEWAVPADNESVVVNADIRHNNGLSEVYLYYGTGIYGTFRKVLMHDDGQHSDGASNDGRYGATIPAHQGNTYVRFYIEAAAGNADKTQSYAPAGAEHDVYVYRVKVTALSPEITPVVINEILASNSSDATDEAGENADWIELHNKTADSVDLSGYYITDNANWLDKWQFPEGVKIGPSGYLIVWADENGSQGPTHTNFKLSASGEEIVLLNNNMQILDSISFSTQYANVSFARIPNATGDFASTYPTTFAANNDGNGSITGTKGQNTGQGILLQPNPATSQVIITGSGVRSETVFILAPDGSEMYQGKLNTSLKMDISSWPAGIYIIRSGSQAEKLVKY